MKYKHHRFQVIIRNDNDSSVEEKQYNFREDKEILIILQKNIKSYITSVKDNIVKRKDKMMLFQLKNLKYYLFQERINTLRGYLR